MVSLSIGRIDNFFLYTFFDSQSAISRDYYINETGKDAFSKGIRAREQSESWWSRPPMDTRHLKGVTKCVADLSCESERVLQNSEGKRCPEYQLSPHEDFVLALSSSQENIKRRKSQNIKAEQKNTRSARARYELNVNSTFVRYVDISYIHSGLISSHNVFQANRQPHTIHTTGGGGPLIRLRTTRQVIDRWECTTGNLQTYSVHLKRLSRYRNDVKITSSKGARGKPSHPDVTTISTTGLISSGSHILVKGAIDAHESIKRSNAFSLRIASDNRLGAL
ncbi:hypothetical protein EVAR_97152_1 [Eumeta japonica]|uniref:Uncharacterized protein n=1 Tax=Eumeta variegata TaxID=151549 RepID=A0A4C1XQR0_EUMVA|nr:hypothetical protein EVAR_97152_1 [Eumeta japonica]